MSEDSFGMGYALGADSGGNNGGFGGDGWWGIIILAMLFGWGGNGGFGGGGGGLNSGFVLNNLDSGIRGVQQGICDSTYALNNTLNGLSGQLANCCCTTQREIDGVNYNMAKGFCDLTNVINNQTRDILDFMTQDKIAHLRDENQTLRFQASQVSQNQFLTQVGNDIVNRLQPVPVPSYTVPNPYVGYGYGYAGYAGGCACA